jgi:uncharacterized protein (TIGR02246 family)
MGSWDRFSIRRPFREMDLSSQAYFRRSHRHERHRCTVESQVRGLVRGDAVAYAGCFSIDSDYVTYNGMLLHGRRESAELHGAFFRRALKGTKLSARIESLAFLAPDVALIHTAGSGAKRGRMDSGRRKSIQTLVIVKIDGQWRIRSFQNTRIRPFSVWLTRQMAGSNGR